MEGFDSGSILKIVNAIFNMLTALLVYFGAIEEGEDPAFKKYLDSIMGLVETTNNALNEE